MAGKKQKPFVVQQLHKAADTFEQRNEVYGEAYRQHGEVMDALFPEGISLEGGNDQSRYGVMNAMVGKIVRYVQNWEEGGHEDSLHDLAVYSQMLQDLDTNG